MLKINSVNKNIKGVNILPKKPIFTKSGSSGSRVGVLVDYFRAPATCRSGLSGTGIPRLAVRMHVAG